MTKNNGLKHIPKLASLEENLNYKSYIPIL